MGQKHVSYPKNEKEKLGYGSYGEVYKDKWNGKIVAAKKIHDHWLNDKKKVARFVAECELLRRLEHPNILKVFHIVHEPKTSPILITELLDCDMRQHLSECKTSMPLEELVTIMLDVAKGLKYLHGQDEPIIHRDLCPKNILLDKSNPGFIRAIICDIGLAKILGDISKECSPNPGTQVYMAPETIIRLEPGSNSSYVTYDTKIDIYSFGITLEEVISQFPETTVQAECQVNSQLHEDLERLEDSKTIAFCHLFELVRVCSEDDPRKRPKAEDIVQILCVPLFKKECVKCDLQSKIMEVYEDYRQLLPFRRQTIRELEEMNLDEITTSLDEFHRNANIATAVGATTSVVGTGLVVGGLVGSLFTFGATIPIMIAGVVTSTAGGLTTFGSKMSEIIKEKINFKKVEDAIAGEKEKAENLGKSLGKLDKFIERNVKSIIEKNEELDDKPIPKDAIGAVLAVTSSGVTAGTAGARMGTAVFLDTLSVASRAAHVAGVVVNVISLPIDTYLLVNSLRQLKKRSPSEVAEKIRVIQEKMKCPSESEFYSDIKKHVNAKTKELKFEMAHH